MSHDGLPPRHPLDADRQHHGDDSGQPFGHGRHRKRDAKHEDVEKRRQTVHVLDENNRHDHQDRNRDHDQAQPLPHAVELLLKRCRAALNVRQHAGDATHFGSHSRGGHDRAAAAVADGGPAVDHVGAVAQCDFARYRFDVLRHRQTLTGERRFGDAQCYRFDQTGIGGDRVAFFDDEDVAGHDVCGRNTRRLPIPNHVGVGGCRLAQRRDCRLGPLLLDVPEQRVQQHDPTDGDGLVRQRRVALVQPQSDRDGRGNQEQHDQSVAKLREELSPRWHRTLGRQLIRAVAREPRTRFRL